MTMMMIREHARVQQGGLRRKGTSGRRLGMGRGTRWRRRRWSRWTRKDHLLVPGRSGLAEEEGVGGRKWRGREGYLGLEGGISGGFGIGALPWLVHRRCTPSPIALTPWCRTAPAPPCSTGTSSSFCSVYSPLTSVETGLTMCNPNCGSSPIKTSVVNSIFLSFLFFSLKIFPLFFRSFSQISEWVKINSQNYIKG